MENNYNDNVYIFLYLSLKNCLPRAVSVEKTVLSLHKKGRQLSSAAISLGVNSLLFLQRTSTS